MITTTSQWYSLPSTVLKTKIGSTAKILFQIILGLSQEEGYCYASNEYLSEQLGRAEKTIKNLLTFLKGAGLIWTEVSRRKGKIQRKIFPKVLLSKKKKPEKPEKPKSRKWGTVKSRKRDHLYKDEYESMNTTTPPTPSSEQGEASGGKKEVYRRKGKRTRSKTVSPRTKKIIDHVRKKKNVSASAKASTKMSTFNPRTAIPAEKQKELPNRYFGIVSYKAKCIGWEIEQELPGYIKWCNDIVERNTNLQTSPEKKEGFLKTCLEGNKEKYQEHLETLSKPVVSQEPTKGAFSSTDDTGDQLKDTKIWAEKYRNLSELEKRKIEKVVKKRLGFVTDMLCGEEFKRLFERKR